MVKSKNFVFPPLHKNDICVIAIFIIAMIAVTFFYFPTKKENLTPGYSHKFRNSQSLDFSDISSDSPKYTNIWGEENISFPKNNTVVTKYPKGSYKPSAQPRGGAGFIYTSEDLLYAPHTMLTYKIRFNENFDFVKGGKLPGLCGGSCPRGGNTDGDGFSTRFMWRTDGDLEVYGYFPEITGKSIQRGMFRFEPGKTYEIAQEIKINTPGVDNGMLKVYVDMIPVYQNDAMRFRNTEQTLSNKVLFSTFFGGGEASWATPVDTSILFSDFTVYWD